MTITSLFQRGIYRLFILGLITLLVACGGGGGKSNSQAAISSVVASNLPLSSSSLSSSSSSVSSFLMGGAIQAAPLNIADVVTTLAGAAPDVDGVGAAARFSYPASVVSDGTNLYIADTYNNKIRKIVIATGAVTTLAGGGSVGRGDGTGTEAEFFYPFGITIDGANLYVTEGGGTIRKIVIATGLVTTLAGSGLVSDTDGTGTAASFNDPHGITTDGTNLYVADKWNNKIRQIVIATGVVTTVAGNGEAGSVDGVGSWASFIYPVGITTDGTNLYVTDKSHKIRKIVIATSEVTTLVGSGLSGNVDGAGTAASFNYPFGMITDGTNLYVADTGNHAIRKIVIATGVATTVAGSGSSGNVDGTGLAASFAYPTGITTDGTNLYIAESGNTQIRKMVIATGVVTRLAGSPPYVDGTGMGAGFNDLFGVTTDGTNLYIADTEQHKIRKIVIATGVVTTLAGSGSPGSADGISTAASFKSPHGITTDGSNLYIADTGNHNIRQIVIATGIVTTLAGRGSPGHVDRTGMAASFTSPKGITINGIHLYIADTGNYRIRKIVIATGVVTTFAGSGYEGDVDGTYGEASFYEPEGITTDGTNLYIADTSNHKIRKIVMSTGDVSTLAGSGLESSADGTSTAASFAYPTGITTDGTNLYIADTYNHKIRKIVMATGVVTTLAGSGGRGSVDGSGTAASFDYPNGITTDGFELFVADTNAIRKIH